MQQSLSKFNDINLNQNELKSMLEDKSRIIEQQQDLIESKDAQIKSLVSELNHKEYQEVALLYQIKLVRFSEYDFLLLEYAVQYLDPTPLPISLFFCWLLI